MTRSSPGALGLCTLVAAAILLGACGKKSDLSPPEGQEDAYTHPRIYPAVPRQDPLSPFPDSRTSPTKTYGKG